jgi:hypothetical protein
MHALFFYHLIATLVHVASFIFLMQYQVDGEMLYELIVPYAEYGGSGALTTTFVESKVTGEFSLLTLLVVNEAITAISHLSGLIGFGLYRRQMVEDDRHLEVIRRYVEYAITAALLEVVLYVLLGGRDANLLLAIVVTNVVIQILGYMIERTRNQQRQIYLNLSGFLLLMVPIVSFLTVATMTEGFLAVSVYYTILYVLFGLHSLLHVLSRAWRQFVDKDAGFIILGVATKEILTWMAVALQAKLYVDHGVSIKSLADNLDLDFFLQWFPIGGILVAAAALFVSSRFPIEDSYESI